MVRKQVRASAKRDAKKGSGIKSHRWLFAIFLAITLLYAAITFFGPTDLATLAKYHISQARFHELSLTITVPFVFIWLSAYYGYAIFRNYAQLLKDTEEGAGFRQIAHGLGILAFSLPINSLLSSSINLLLIHHPSYLIPATIIKNYTSLILPFMAFVLASRGAEKITMLVKRKKAKALNPLYWAPWIILVSSLFSWLMIARPADTRIAVNIYHLPNWLIVTTLAAPYLYTWFRGILAAYFLSFYQLNVKGKVYRDSLRYLSAGIFVVILVNILIQLIVTVSTRLYRLQLTPVLLIVYLLIAFYAVGFGLIAAGAKKMRKIEEV